MRVLLVTDWPRGATGTERYVGDLRAGLSEAGEEVRLLTSSAGSAAGGTAEYVARTSTSRRAQALTQIASPGGVATMRRALADFEPDVVHLAMILPYLSPAVLAPLRARPTTLMVTDFKAVCPTGTKLLPSGEQCRKRMGVPCLREGCLAPARAARDAARYGAFRLGLRNVDRVLACSRHLASELRVAGIEAEPVGLPVAAPRPSFRREPASAPRFLYGGRLAPVKGVELLLSAFAELRRSHPEATLLICGDGSDRGEIRRTIDEFAIGSAVELRLGLGWDWMDAFSDPWALVAPSLYREPLGLVAIEAIAHGLPVIASEEGGFGETVEHGRSGLLFPNGDRGALLERMLSVAERRSFPDHAPDPGARSRLTDRHDLGDHVRTMQRIWSQLGA